MVMTKFAKKFVTKLPLDYKTTVNYKTTSGKKQTRKINKFELLFILVMMTGSLIFVL